MKEDLAEISNFLKSSVKPHGRKIVHTATPDVHTASESTVPLVSPEETISDDQHDDSVVSIDESVPDVPSPDDKDDVTSPDDKDKLN